MNTPRPRLSAPRAALVPLAVLALTAACSEKSPSSPAPGPPPAPTAGGPVEITIAAERPSLVFRYLDPNLGQVVTASAIADIPEGARGQVIVFDIEAPPPAGWDLVADLSRGLPAKATPRQGFSFPIAARPAPAAGPAASSAREVVMFATAWCGYCNRARAFFKQHRVPFTEHDVENDPNARSRLSELGRRARVPESQLQGVPIVFVDGEPMVGWDEARLKRLLGI